MQDKFLHGFNLIPGVGYMSLNKLWNYFGDWEHAWKMADEWELLQAGLDKDLVPKIIAARRGAAGLNEYGALAVIDPDREYEKLWQKDIVLISRNSLEYPEQLRQIPCPPFLVYRKGAKLRSELLFAPLAADADGGARTCVGVEKTSVPLNQYVAIVGTRLPSLYGEKITQEIGEGIAAAGGTIVSGLAYGVDAIAHYAAVKTGKPTVAVLASGLERITPTAHYSLARKILETGGTLISEYVGANVSYKSNYLERNRLISSLCKATIVIEAKEHSGALITANHALQQGRDIYALVGDITRPQAQGCLNILMRGEAQPIFSVNELLQQLGFNSVVERAQNLSIEEKIILDLLAGGSACGDEIALKSGLGVGTLNVVLTGLELKGLARKNAFSQWETK